MMGALAFADRLDSSPYAEMLDEKVHAHGYAHGYGCAHGHGCVGIEVHISAYVRAHVCVHMSACTLCISSSEP